MSDESQHVYLTTLSKGSYVHYLMNMYKDNIDSQHTSIFTSTFMEFPREQRHRPTSKRWYDYGPRSMMKGMFILYRFGRLTLLTMTQRWIKGFVEERNGGGGSKNLSEVKNK